MYRYYFLCYLLGCVSQLQAQCYEDRHSTNWFDGWVSCESFPNPISDYGNGHWIMYDFGKPFDLKGTHFWNVNDPKNLDRGLKEIALDYSMDGSAWQHAGVYTIAMANGESTYEGVVGPDLDGVQSRFVLVTALENYGGTCFGLSEIRFEALENTLTSTEDIDLVNDDCLSISAYPNPYKETNRVVVHSRCAGLLSYRLVDVLGRSILSGSIESASGFYTLDLNQSQLSSGQYYLYVQQGQEHSQEMIIKQ